MRDCCLYSFVIEQTAYPSAIRVARVPPPSATGNGAPADARQVANMAIPAGPGHAWQATCWTGAPRRGHSAAPAESLDTGRSRHALADLPTGRDVSRLIDPRRSAYGDVIANSPRGQGLPREDGV